MIKLQDILKELEFGSGLGSTEPDYKETPISITIQDRWQNMDPTPINGLAHMSTIPNTSYPVIAFEGEEESFKIMWQKKLGYYTKFGDDDWTIEPNDDAALSMMIKLRKKSEYAGI